MKKLTNGNTWDNDLANKIDELIDLVNSQQETIEKLRGAIVRATKGEVDEQI